MSSNKYAAPLILELRPSRWLGALVIAAHASALAVLPPLAMPWWMRLGLAVAIVGHLFTTLRNEVLLRRPNAVIKAVWDTDNQWWLTTRDGRTLQAELAAGSYVQPWLVILRLAERDKKKRCCHIIVMPDSVQPNVHRQLRVRLGMLSPPDVRP